MLWNTFTMLTGMCVKEPWAWLLIASFLSKISKITKALWSHRHPIQKSRSALMALWYRNCAIKLRLRTNKRFRHKLWMSLHWPLTRAVTNSRPSTWFRERWAWPLTSAHSMILWTAAIIIKTTYLSNPWLNGTKERTCLTSQRSQSLNSRPRAPPQRTPHRSWLPPSTPRSRD